MNFVTVICTYKRVELLRLLLEDVVGQTSQPNSVIIVDGDPGSGEVQQLLNQHPWPAAWHIVYQPSNHGNLPYQRYLGWRLAANMEADYLLFFDDDLRLTDSGAIEQMMALFNNEEIVGITADTSDGEVGRLAETEYYQVGLTKGSKKSPLIQLLGSSGRINPGGLTPSGNRVFPPRKDAGFEEVQWLQGRVMFYRMIILHQKTFSKNLFSLYERRFGKAEDTYLSRQVGQHGKLMLGFGLGIEHPNADTPKCYPIEARKFAYASAYSRRFLNDHYRVKEPPTLGDRWALLKSYEGNSLLNWLGVLKHPKKYQLHYAWGYTLGALRGIFQKPTAKNLTPDIDWQADAEAALKKAIIIQ